MSLITTVIRTSTLTPAARLIADETLQGRPLELNLNDDELSCLLFPAHYGSVLCSLNGLRDRDQPSGVVRQWQSLPSSLNIV